uniref:TYR_PHOSPHATASE_2 domain-containing protein n=1 Tax=Soboliphyme baturini TaxID=241478 RepID=A0A183J4K5_9BILA
LLRWFDYVPLGDVIPGTRFICCKVSLTKVFPKPLRSFRPEDLASAVAEKGYQLGLVIDLTYTDRYYSGKEFTDRSIEYVKIFIPHYKYFRQFCDVVEDFHRRAPQNALIAVHCTHGINRTGYFVCRYLVEQLRWTASQAIEGMYFPFLYQTAGHMSLGFFNEEFPKGDHESGQLSSNNQVNFHSVQVSNRDISKVSFPSHS